MKFDLTVGNTVAIGSRRGGALEVGRECSNGAGNIHDLDSSSWGSDAQNNRLIVFEGPGPGLV
jgi:hypothetical protein